MKFLKTYKIFESVNDDTYEKWIKIKSEFDKGIEAAEMYDKVALYLIGKHCFINFEEKREEYLKSDLEDFN